MQIKHNGKTYKPKAYGIANTIEDWIIIGYVEEVKDEIGTCYGTECPGCVYCDKYNVGPVVGKIEEVSIYEPRKDWINQDTYSIDESEKQLEYLTNAVNQLIKSHNQK